MIKKLQQAVPVIGLLLSSIGFSQSYIGHTIDNYSGVHGVLYNPSFVADSRLRTDINLSSASIFGGSDYFSMDMNRLFESESGFTFEDDITKYPKENNQFFLNVDVLGPAFMFRLSKRSSIAISSRMRAFMNMNNVNGTLYETVSEEFDFGESFNVEMEKFNGTVHTWAELGFTYGLVLVDSNKNMLKAGATFKYLQGFGSNFVSSPQLTANYDANAQILRSTGSLSYGNSKDFNGDEIDFEELSSGFGADFGIAYEYRPYEDADSNGPRRYKLKLAASVTDFGNISYDESSSTNYDLNKTVDQVDFIAAGGDLNTVLEENYPGTEEISTKEINLPTALHLMLDYEVRKRLYLSVQGSYSLVDATMEQANRIINTLTATPRLETQWLSIYLPMSLRQYDGFAMGAGLRFGPLTVGSGSIVTNYFTDESKTTDVYVGLKIPIYR